MIKKILCYLSQLFDCGCAFPLVRFRFQRADLDISGEYIEMNLKEGQSVLLTALLVTAAGHAAAYDKDSVSWESSNPSVASVDPILDFEGPGEQARVFANDGSDNESVVITFTADGDPDEGEERILIGTVAVTVTQGEAVAIELQVGEIEDNGTSEEEETPAEETSTEG